MADVNLFTKLVPADLTVSSLSLIALAASLTTENTATFNELRLDSTPLEIAMITLPPAVVSLEVSLVNALTKSSIPVSPSSINAELNLLIPLVLRSFRLSMKSNIDVADTIDNDIALSFTPATLSE